MLQRCAQRRRNLCRAPPVGKSDRTTTPSHRAAGQAAFGSHDARPRAEKLGTLAEGKAAAKERTRMTDRILRGSRLGAVSYETDRDHDLAPRRTARYRCSNGEEFDIPFADDAEVPGTWMCRNGLEGQLIDGPAPDNKKVKPPRTHWDMLLERRSVDELEELLKERLDLLKKKRRR
jgi:hypothetical protein